MNTHYFSSRLFHSSIHLRAVVTLVALLGLVWISPALCDEIHVPAKNGDLAIVQVLLKDKPDLVFSKGPASFLAASLRATQTSGPAPAKRSAEASRPRTTEKYEQLDWGDLGLELGVVYQSIAFENGRVIHIDGAEVKRFAIVNTEIELVTNKIDLENGSLFITTKKCGKMRVVFAENRATLWATPSQKRELVKVVRNSKDSNGDTLLHYAASGDHKDVAELLLANGADVNAKDNDGGTPLHIAAGRARLGTSHKEMAELLLANGADVNAKDNDGRTPLHYASGAVLHVHKDVAELLLANGADVNTKDGKGFTPLHYAESGITAMVDRSSHDVAELLRQHGGHD